MVTLMTISIPETWSLPAGEIPLGAPRLAADAGQRHADTELGERFFLTILPMPRWCWSASPI